MCNATFGMNWPLFYERNKILGFKTSILYFIVPLLNTEVLPLSCMISGVHFRYRILLGGPQKQTWYDIFIKGRYSRERGSGEHPCQGTLGIEEESPES